MTLVSSLSPNPPTPYPTPQQKEEETLDKRKLLRKRRRRTWHVESLALCGHESAQGHIDRSRVGGELG